MVVERLGVPAGDMLSAPDVVADAWRVQVRTEPRRAVQAILEGQAVRLMVTMWWVLGSAAWTLIGMQVARPCAARMIDHDHDRDVSRQIPQENADLVAVVMLFMLGAALWPLIILWFGVVLPGLHGFADWVHDDSRGPRESSSTGADRPRAGDPT